jgi:ribosome biogenesis GTPase A
MLSLRATLRTVAEMNLARFGKQRPSHGFVEARLGAARVRPRHYPHISRLLGYSASTPVNSDHSSGIAVFRKKGKGSGYCYGCGADLVKASNDGDGEGGGRVMQTIQKKKGFWYAKKDELKKSQIKNWALCPRCRKLQEIAKKGTSRAAKELEELGPDSKMTEVFRQEVSKVRTKEKAVVVLCVDAVNISGSLIKTIRNYVGGNPILLAVTRCDLLPGYIWDRYKDSLDKLKQVFRERSREIMPAEIYLCSEEAEFKRMTGGLKELTDDLWNHLNGRDPYVVGSANIGKSTLTDILIAKLASKGEKAGHFGDRLSERRLNALRTARITKSSMPGTTLQNVRVPCFEDHNQALWDTPGLLLDESLKHFPVRNLRAIRAQRPSQIQPQILETDKKACCLVITEKGDDLPLMRIEIRQKKNAEGEGPLRLVWNSTLNLDAAIVDIKSTLEDERHRRHQIEEEQEIQRHEAQKRESETAHLSREEKMERKKQREEERKKAAEEEKERLGVKEYEKREKQRLAEVEEKRRFKALSQLHMVNEVVIERNVGIDLAIANFGWLGILVPRTTMIRSYAPSSGVRVSHHPTLGLPFEFGEYIRENIKPKASETKKEDISESLDGSGDSNDEDLDDDSGDMEFGGDDDDWDFGYDDEFDLNWDLDDYEENDALGLERFGFNRSDKDDAMEDKWAAYSGANVGWQYDADTRFMKSDIKEGWNPLREEDDGMLKL